MLIESLQDNGSHQTRTERLDHGLAMVAVFVVIILATRAHSYLLFHSLAELFSIIVGLTAFSIAWNTRRNIESGFLLVVGLTFGPVAGIDLMHTLAYKGMGVFVGADANLPTQLWIAGRVLEVGAIVVATLVAGDRPSSRRVVSTAIGAMSLLLASIFWWDIFPDCWRAETGLTPFKVAAEYAFIGLLSLALVRLWMQRHLFAPDLFPFVASGVALVIVEEACFTLYTDVYGALNMAGHIAKIGSFYLIYAGLVRFGFARPQELLYRRLNLLNARLADDVLRSNERASLAVAAVGGAAWEWDMRSPAIVLTARHAEWLQVPTTPTSADLARRLSMADRQALEQVVAPRPVGEARTVEVRIDIPGSPPRWLRMVTRVILAPGGEAPVMIGFDADITARKAAELEREALHCALERSHAELQRFAEVLAHHLQEPVQRQLRFCQMLQRTLSAPLSPDSQEALHYILDGGRRLSELLGAVQLYLALDALPPAVCVGDKALDAACQRLAARLTVCGAVVEHAPLPQVPLSHERLRDLFVILLDNALEYRHADRAPHIRIDATTAESQLHIQVSDNGIGIEERYLEQIFGVFERLHPRSAHAGTGIGLALARKIAETAGGRLWATSRLGEGTTFHLAFPVERPE